ncbi:MAG: lipopolysaccharide biosynthesis protein [Taibaiella sp.]|nr:lipopolysaccharide biosynthesis protein [Taibaiella sp.]
MELLEFFKFLYRRKITLIVIPLITVIATFFLVRNIADVFVSNTRIATGLVDKSQQVFTIAGTFDQEYKINQEFENLNQIILSKKIQNQVSYKLMLHDLGKDSAFRKPSKLVKELNQSALQHAINTYRTKYATMDELSLWNNDENGLYKLMKSMGYDNESLNRKLTVYRVGNSDFINVEFESENPNLSAFVVNTLCNEFITYYNTQNKENKNKAVSFYDSLLKQKQAIMINKTSALKDYKIKNRVLNMNDQAKTLYGQIADFETRKEQAQRDIIANTAALKTIDEKFNPEDRKYLESAISSINTEIVQTKEQIKLVNQDYVQSGFDPKYKSMMDSLQGKLNAQIMQASDKYLYSPLVMKENLVTQKMNLELALELAKNSVQSVNGELARLNEKLDILVPNEAVIQSSESEIDIASKEYLDVLQKYNQASIESTSSRTIKLVERAMPGDLKPGKKMLLVILSGIISFVFCVLVFFVLFYFDRSISTPAQLANASGLPVIGYLNLERGRLDINQIWNNPSPTKPMRTFKDLLRSLRFEVESDLGKGKVVAITSMVHGEGKTFVTISLAYALSRMLKDVLVIDGNFKQPDITKLNETSNSIEEYLRGSDNMDFTLGDVSINILGNKGGDSSVLEINNYDAVVHRMEELRAKFDIILIETTSLEGISNAKEWIAFADKVVTVYEAGSQLNHAKAPQVEYLKSLGDKFSGFVLNKIPDNALPVKNS